MNGHVRHTYVLFYFQNRLQLQLNRPLQLKAQLVCPLCSSPLLMVLLYSKRKNIHRSIEYEKNCNSFTSMCFRSFAFFENRLKYMQN